MKLIVGADPAEFDAFARASGIAHYSKTSPFIAFKAPEYQKGELLALCGMECGQPEEAESLNARSRESVPEP